MESNADQSIRDELRTDVLVVQCSQFAGLKAKRIPGADFGLDQFTGFIPNGRIEPPSPAEDSESKKRFGFGGE